MDEAEEDVFEDALEEVEEASKNNEAKNDHLILNNNNNNNVYNKSKSSLTTFKLTKLKKKKSDKSPEPPSTPVEREPLPLGVGISEAQMAIDLFFNNNFQEAREVSERHCGTSIYHALGRGTFHFLRAVMTFDQEHVEQASAILSESVSVIDEFRKKVGGLSSMVRRPDSDSYSELEVHAELVYAECLLLKAMLSVCEDEALVSFVKAGLKIRQCYMSFKECWHILQNRNWSKDQFKNHFEGGVRLGIGTFNLLMSLLPPRITKLLEFVGFTGSRSSKDVGLSELLRCYSDHGCLRQFLASLILLGYHLFICNHMGQVAESDYSLVDDILKSKLSKYPNGAFFLFFQARYNLVQAKCESSLTLYKQANACQSEWPQFHHVAYWEMTWASSYQCDWRKALFFSDKLLKESKWSPCLYSYLKAAFLCMLPREELSPTEHSEVCALMSAVPSLRQKIAGKSLPMEKFAARKAERFLVDGSLVLPGLELVYLWNGFTIIAKQFTLLERVYVVVQEEEAKSNNREGICLLNLLKGMCLKHMGAPLAAEECFKSVLVSGHKLSYDAHLVPFTMVELALLTMQDTERHEEAAHMLDQAKNYKDYSLQSRLHFRIHAAQAWLRDRGSGREGGRKEIDREQQILPHLANVEETVSSI